MLIKNCIVFNGEEFIPVDAVEYQNGIVTQMYSDYSGDDCIDAQGRILCPGFVDVHIHGSFGTDVMSKNGISTLIEKLPTVGTTAFCPTSVAETDEHIIDFLGYVKEEMPRTDGARVLGAHLEGPFFAEENRGAHASEMLRNPTIENYMRFAKGYEDIILRMSMAPELPGGSELAAYLYGKGVVVAAAHNNATAAEMEHAIEQGVFIATHTFNGFSPFHHRQENSISVVLTDPRVTCEFIPDLQHISKYAIKLILSCKGYENTFICSDAISAGNLKEGDFVLGALEVHVENYVARLVVDGRLAGSTTCMAKGVQNLVHKVGVPLEKALRLATLNPAKSIHKEHELGQIRVGGYADFVLLNDDLSIKSTYIRGKCVYSC